MKTIIALAAFAVALTVLFDEEVHDYLRTFSSLPQSAAGVIPALADDATDDEANVIKRWQDAPGFFTRKIKVQDGDTIITTGNKHFRLLCIDAPERGQQHGKAAKAFLQSLVSGGAEIRTKGKDKYGRSLAIIIVDIDGKKAIANYEMLRWGYAWVYRRFSESCGLPESPMHIMEHQARQTKRGLWKTQTPTPPWKWRNQNKK